MSNAPPPPKPPINDPLEALAAAGRSTLRRLNGALHEVTPVVDEAGELLNWAVQPVMVELKLRDVMQIVVGATILGSPLVLSDEAMAAAAALDRTRIVVIAVVSVLFVSGFVYFNFYRKMIRGHAGKFVARVLTTYGLALVTVAGLLWLFGLSGWGDNPELALRRVVVVGFPASMFATVADAIK